MNITGTVADNNTHRSVIPRKKGTNTKPKEKENELSER
jgi:hypothetical protein